MAAARLRVAVDAGAWAPEPPELDFLLSLFSDEERAACMAFRRDDDKKRAIISRLLQRHAAAACLGLDFHQVATARTRGGKPFVTNARPDGAPVNWNYSVSHEGRYVVLCSESPAVAGCDVTAPRSHRPGKAQSIHDFLKSFRAQLTPPEWDSIMALQPDEAAMEAQFQRYWSLKEAYSKALGLGLAAPLAEASFTLSHVLSCASLCLAGVEQEDWAFGLHKLPHGHWVAVARAPPAQIIDAYGVFSATLTRTDFEPEEWRSVLQAPEPAFALVPVCSLLPAQCLPGYEAAGGDVF